MTRKPPKAAAIAVASETMVISHFFDIIFVPLNILTLGLAKRGGKGLIF